MKKALVIFIALLPITACSPISSQSGGSEVTEAAPETNPIDCLAIENTGNVIKETPAFSGSSINNLWVQPRFKYSNYCEKNVVGLKGTVSFQNILGDEIFSGEWTDDYTISVGKAVKSDPDEGYKFTQFDDEHGVLLGLDAKKSNAVFTLETLVFDDGTKLTR
jgi:hypothetical protein